MFMLNTFCTFFWRRSYTSLLVTQLVSTSEGYSVITHFGQAKAFSDWCLIKLIFTSVLWRQWPQNLWPHRTILNLVWNTIKWLWKQKTQKKKLYAKITDHSAILDVYQMFLTFCLHPSTPHCSVYPSTEIVPFFPCTGGPYRPF